jgi:hypothetical protein
MPKTVKTPTANIINIKPSLPKEPVHLCYTVLNYLDLIYGAGAYDQAFAVDYLSVFGVNRSTATSCVSEHRTRLALSGPVEAQSRNKRAIQFAVDSVRNGGNIASRWRAYNEAHSKPETN